MKCADNYSTIAFEKPYNCFAMTEIELQATIAYCALLPGSNAGNIDPIQVNHVYLTDFSQNQAVSSKELLGD